MSTNPQVLAKLKHFLGEDVQEQVLLKPFTTMKVGGVADYFIVAKTVEQLVVAVRAAEQAEIDWRVIGNASNILASDQGFRGLVIQNRTSDLTFVPNSTEAIVASGVPLARVIIEAAKRGLAGLEPMFGIPASVGGALYGNAGSQGAQVTQFVRDLTLYKPKEDTIVKVPVSWLHAAYRTTRLKSERSAGKTDSPIILTAKFVFMRQKPEATQAKIREYDEWRKTHQPIGLANCGSVFKNPGTAQQESAGYLLEHSGAKSIRHGQAHVSKQHANFLINDGQSSAKDVQAVIEDMKRKVADQSGFQLHEEIEYFGDWSSTNGEVSHE